MIIESIRAFALRVPSEQTYWGARNWSAASEQSLGVYPPHARRHYIYSETIDSVLVRVRTKDGVVGWGEAKAPIGPEVTARIVDDLLAPLIIGTRLDSISHTWDRMYTAMRVRGHDSGFWLEALSGVDIALWDAFGRTLGQPVSALLGGRYRSRIDTYASGVPAASAGSGSEGQDRVAEEASRIRDWGFKAAKVAIGISPEADLTSVSTVASVFSAQGAVFVDAAGAYDVPQAIRLGKAFAELGVGFFEMPIPPEDLNGYARLANRLDMPVALDSIANRHRAVEFLRADALHVIQPDVCRAGGITETMRIAAIADAFGAIATPHVSIGSPIHLAASVHCASATPNFEIMEYWVGHNPLNAIVNEPIRVNDGVIDVPHGPGLGVEVDEDSVRALSQRAEAW